MTAESRFHAVLIGTGAIAREHLNALSRIPFVEVAAVCDVSRAKAEATAERFGVRRWFTDYHKMLDTVDADVVHITTPVTSHYSIARDALRRKLNVFCEKPITMEYSEFLELKELATCNGLLLMENQNARCHSSVQWMRQLASRGDLGEIVDVQVQVFLNIGVKGSPFVDPGMPHPCLSLRGGAIGDFLPHIAYLVHLFAGPRVAARSVWWKHCPESSLRVDEFRALIRGERAVGLAAFSANAQPNGFWVRVAGTKMHVEANLFEPPRLTQRRLRSGAPPVAALVDGLAEAWEVARGTCQSLRRKLAGTSQYDGLPEFIAQTYGALAGEQSLPVSLAEIDEVALLVSDLAGSEHTF